MLAVFLISMLILLLLIPNEIWYGLLYVGLVLVVGFIAWWSFVFWLAT
jgi:hypothetical protein